ncbi:MAG: hypothetical protein KF770_23705, partial [Anaerolineae bacterium]|nr:hypothetical protein [Anaerolineae bacterium]
MDAHLVPRKEKITQEFKELGVGLCAVLPHKMEWIVQPRMIREGIGFEREYIISSAASLSRQTLWSAR